MRPTGKARLLGESKAHANAKKNFAQVQGKINWSYDQAWRRVISELNKLIADRLKRRPRTSKNLKAVGFIREDLSLPKAGRLIDGDAIDQISRVISVLGHDEAASQMFLRHLSLSLTKTEQSTLEKFFVDGTLIPENYKEEFTIEDLRSELRKSRYSAAGVKLKPTNWKI